MGIPKLPNREKVRNELTRRYDEVLRKSESGIHNDEEAQQFISLIAHYVYYVKKSGLTQTAISKLFEQQELLAGDKVLIEEAERIIDQMKIDRKKLVRYAKSKNIDENAYEFKEGRQQITGDVEFSYYLHHLDAYLKRPSDQQYISELTREISHLLSANFSVQNLGGETSKLKKMRAEYLKLSEDFNKKLRMQGVYLDYMRVEDYKALDLVWREVYQEGEQDERIMFHLMYGDLFEKNRRFSGGQQADADEFISKHITHLQRVHNYLMDSIEDIPYREKFLHWTVEHFGPTLVSLLVIIVLSLLLNWIGIHKGIEELRKLIGL